MGKWLGAVLVSAVLALPAWAILPDEEPAPKPAPRAAPKPKPKPKPAPAPRKAAPAAANAGGNAELLFWDSIKDSDNPADFEAYLEQYPKGRFARLARNRLGSVPGAEAKPSAPTAEVVSPPLREPAMIRLPGFGIEMGKYEVTQGEWRAVMGSNPSRFSSCGDTCPVEKVSWNDAQNYIERLNQRTGKSYRLPTDQEWYSACQAGGNHEYCGSDSIEAVAWYGSNSGDRTHPAGQKQPNAFGLYDMSGNVWEWTNDCWEGDCGARVVRGGSWYGLPEYVRAAYRNWYGPGYTDHSFGFRLARTLP